jgi:FtsZ-interacting cell division protein YlmF
VTGGAAPGTLMVVGDLVDSESDVHVFRPGSFDDVVGLADAVKAGAGVLVHLPRDNVLAQRIGDFVGGVAFSLNRKVRRTGTRSILVLAP